MILYVLEFFNGKFYVGITSKVLERRLSGHVCKAKLHPETKINFAIKKYYPQEVIVHWADGYDSWDTLCEVEKREIERYDSFVNGYNSTLGGDGTLGIACEEEKRKKISKSNTGRTAHNKGKKLSLEARNKLSASMKGRVPHNKGLGIQVHGTMNSYTHYNCRCVLCIEGARLYRINKKK